jgi:hypothetical protein
MTIDPSLSLIGAPAGPIFMTICSLAFLVGLMRTFLSSTHTFALLMFYPFFGPD